jgi:exonuclease SbcD
MVAPLRARGSDDVVAVCLAVPYVHEYRLGVRTSDIDQAATREQFRSAFAGLYRGLADLAEARFPGVPIVATGHLTLGTGATREDYPLEIHRVGTLEGLPTGILDPRIRYAALGHIHRAYPVAGSVARYCGSPIPYSLTEMATERRVLLVDVGEDVRVEAVVVPRLRDLVQLIGPPDDVVAELQALRWSTELPPLVHVRVETALPEPGLTNRLHEAAAAHPEGARPVLVEVQQRAAEVERPGGRLPTPALASLRPEEVFELLCDARGLDGEDRSAVQAAFHTVATADPATLQRMIDDIDLPPSASGDAP